MVEQSRYSNGHAKGFYIIYGEKKGRENTTIHEYVWGKRGVKSGYVSFNRENNEGF